LASLHNLVETIHLRTLSVLSGNTEYFASKPRPILYGIAVEVHGGYCFPAKFMYRGPEIPLRTARLFRGNSDTLNIYDYENNELQIGPFDYKDWPMAERILLQPDAWIRQYLSTSPAVEKEDFVQGTKAALVTILEHPKPLKSKFPNNKPLKYCRKQDGFWRLKNDQEGPGSSGLY
jgi:protein N-terminal asparagine amidohydrolase